MPLPPPHSVEVGLLEEDRVVKVGMLEEEVVPTRGAERREEREEGAEEDMAQQHALVGSGMERSRASAWVKCRGKRSWNVHHRVDLEVAEDGRTRSRRG